MYGSALGTPELQKLKPKGTEQETGIQLFCFSPELFNSILLGY